MTTIGPNLFNREPDGRYTSSIGTLFPRHGLLVTTPPMHALQRDAFRDWLMETHAKTQPSILGDKKLTWEAAESVDLIFAPGNVVLIRPELERLDLAFEADRLLQESWNVPYHRIRFLSVRDRRVRQALRERGELWRMSAPPAGHDEIGTAIAHSRVALAESPIYYYNPHTGTRFVTCAGFASLAQLDPEPLARQLDEIAEHATRRNRHGHPEVAFFGADPLRFGGPNFVGVRFADLPSPELRSRYDALLALFRNATEPDLRVDNPGASLWRRRLFAAIGSDPHQEVTPELLPGRSPDFFLRIRWLPGGQFEEGEFVFAPVFPKEDRPPDDPELQPLWDPLAHGFITNFIREYGNIEYLNLGRIEPGPGPEPELHHDGRRGVYLAEIKVRGEPNPHLLFLRVLRWGIRERLEERDERGKSKELVRAILETEEYVDYTLDRRLGCLQFGMHLPARVNMRRVSEPYFGNRSEFQGRFFPVIYFERDYLPGIPTNRLPNRKLADPRYALALARLMGQAAAPNLVVGRTHRIGPKDLPGDPLFDDGDEIIVEDSDGLPSQIVLVDHGGAFADWKTPSLLPFARAYAQPVNCRLELVPEPRPFAEAYLEALSHELARIQTDYRRLQKGFDGLFKHLPYDAEGSFACRWAHILNRLQATAPQTLIAEISRHITVLS
jgi:hypothetical protein